MRGLENSGASRPAPRDVLSESRMWAIHKSRFDLSTAYAKDTAHVRKQFETSAEQSQYLTTLAQNTSQRTGGQHKP